MAGTVVAEDDYHGQEVPLEEEVRIGFVWDLLHSEPEAFNVVLFACRT